MHNLAKHTYVFERAPVAVMRALIPIFFFLFFSHPAHADQLEDAQTAYDHADYETAKKLAQPLADQGNAEAQYDIGDLYYDGKGVQRDFVEAFFWFSLGLKAGFHPGEVEDAKRKDAESHLTTDEIEKTTKRVEQWKPVEQMDLVAFQIEADRNDPATVAYVSALRTNAERGDIKSQITLAQLYRMGVWVKTDVAEAIKWQRMAAERGDRNEQSLLGQTYARGLGVSRDDSEAAKWFRKAAEQGERYAQAALGEMYCSGNGGAELDLVQCYKWHLLAGSTDHELASVGLAAKMTSAQIAEAHRQAESWKPTAASVANSPTQADLVPVPGLPKPHPRSVLSEDECRLAPSDAEYFKASAEAGDPRAQFHTAQNYMYGNEGAKKDATEAAKWFSKAADQGMPEAQAVMGTLYASDIEETPPLRGASALQFAKEVAYKPDYTQAAQWFRKAAAQGEEDPAFFLGVLYRDGKGVAQDYAEAYFWLKLVSTNWSHHEDDQRLAGMADEVAHHLTTEQLTTAAKRLAEWKPSRVKVPNSKATINVMAVLCGRGYGFCGAADLCGNIVGIDCNSGGDGPYFFVDKKTKEIIGSCSYWQGSCKPPPEWACGRPKNYH